MADLLTERPANNQQSTKAMLNHREFVAQKLNEYAELGYQLGDKSTGLHWEKAHFPEPERLGGTEWVWLLHDDHMRQGILQSEEFDCCCFYSQQTFEWLDTFPEHCLELSELAWKWFLSHQAKAGHRGGLEAAQTHKRQATNFFSQDFQSEMAKRAAVSQQKNGTGFFNADTQEQFLATRKKNGRGFFGTELNEEKWISLVSGFISHRGGIGLNHKKLGIPGKSRRMQLTPKQLDEIKDLQPIQRLLAIAMDDTDG